VSSPWAATLPGDGRVDECQPCALVLENVVVGGFPCQTFMPHIAAGQSLKTDSADSGVTLVVRRLRGGCVKHALYAWRQQRAKVRAPRCWTGRP